MPSSKLTRFAPTPSGYLHWGNAFSFVKTWLVAQQLSAKVLLRIDDLDAARKRSEYIEDIFRSLEWMGLTYDLGPCGPGDFETHYSQAHRMDLYGNAIQHLAREGLVFACACTRSQIQNTPDKQHARSCKEKNLDLQSDDLCWRVATMPGRHERWVDADGNSHEVHVDQEMRDLIVRRKDGIPAYQLASIIDDAHYGVNFVVRGADLIPSTAAQRWLSRLLPGSHFHRSEYLHHRLLTDDQGQKLSKSADATSLLEMRRQDSSASILYQTLSPYFGLGRPVDTLEQLLEGWLAHHETT